MLVGLVVLASSCGSRDMHRVLRNNLPQPPESPKVLAVYMPWFGDGGHMDVGYSSQDPAVLRRQISQARTLGISGFVVDWYGVHNTFLDKSFALLQQAAAEQHFQVALMYDQPEDSSSEETDNAMQDFAAAYDKYIGPQAPYRSAYLAYNGRPLILIFPKNNGADWDRIRQQVDSWEPPPLLIYKDEAPARYEADFDGYYPWIHPGGDEWAKDGSDWGKTYLQNFYKTAQREHPGKLLLGAAWPGFNDELAPWSLNRYMASHCGKTLESTLRLFRQYDSSSHPAPFLLIETWNDYEEGTAIEKSAFGPCTDDHNLHGGGLSRAAR